MPRQNHKLLIISLKNFKHALRALDHFKKKALENKTAIDLGCGNGKDTLFLLSEGWNVYAIDASIESMKIMETNIPKTLKENLILACVTFNEVKWRHVQFVNASLSLPFCEEKNFPEVWKNITDSIVSGGIFAGHFFGVNDDWKQLFLIEKKDLENLLVDFDILYFGEKEFDKPSLTGPEKHWHIFEVIAKKK